MQNVSMYVTRDTTTALKLPNWLKVTARRAYTVGRKSDATNWWP